MAEKQKQYFNDAQLYPLFMSPRDLVCEMGRGTGKRSAGTADRTFAIVCKVPTVGHQIYPIPSMLLSK